MCISTDPPFQINLTSVQNISLDSVTETQRNNNKNITKFSQEISRIIRKKHIFETIKTNPKDCWKRTNISFCNIIFFLCRGAEPHLKMRTNEFYKFNIPNSISLLFESIFLWSQQKLKILFVAMRKKTLKITSMIRITLYFIPPPTPTSMATRRITFFWEGYVELAHHTL